MPVFVGGDAAGNLFQHRLRRRVADGGVIGRGAGFDHATGDHLPPAAAAHRNLFLAHEMLRPVAGAEPGDGGFEIEAGIGQFAPAAERPAMLNLLTAPGRDVSKGLGIGVAEDAVQIVRIIGGIVFDQGGGFYGGEQFGCHTGGIERPPRNIVQGPALFVDRASHTCFSARHRDLPAKAL